MTPPHRPPYDGPRTFGSVSREQVPLRTPDGPLRARMDPGRRRGSFEERLRPDKRSGLARFVDRYGWRAYAIPVLALATVLGLGNIALGGQPQHTASAPPVTSSSAPARTPSTAATSKATPSPTPKPSPTPTLPSIVPSGVNIAALPSGTASYPKTGNGTFQVVPGTSPRVGSGPLHRYAVEVEGGMTGISASAFAKSVVQTLSDPRSWTHGGLSLERVDSGQIDFRVTLASVQTIRVKCGYTLQVETSCYNSAEHRAFINVSRWVRGAVAYGADVVDYQHYVVNHETGHALGHGHVKCPKAGSPAPVMMEQTLGVTTPGVGACRPNPWPYVNGKLATGPPTQGY
jgi:uncharacterized protein DUF3152